MNNTIKQYYAAVMDCPTYSSRDQSPKAVQDNLQSKIKLAITAAVQDGAIIATGTKHDWSIGFAIDGERCFYDNLISICTPGEKLDLLNDWILGNGDTSTAVEICGFLMGKHNCLDSIARDVASEIINHRNYFDHASDELIAQELPI